MDVLIQREALVVDDNRVCREQPVSYIPRTNRHKWLDRRSKPVWLGDASKDMQTSICRSHTGGSERTRKTPRERRLPGDILPKWRRGSSVLRRKSWEYFPHMDGMAFPLSIYI